jgi:hypothetical protein
MRRFAATWQINVKVRMTLRLVLKWLIQAQSYIDRKVLADLVPVAQGLRSVSVEVLLLDHIRVITVISYQRKPDAKLCFLFLVTGHLKSVFL